MGKSDINITQTQQLVMGFISPIIDEIVDRVSERVLAASKKEPKFYTRKEAAEILHIGFYYLHVWRQEVRPLLFSPMLVR